MQLPPQVRDLVRSLGESVPMEQPRSTYAHASKLCCRVVLAQRAQHAHSHTVVDVDDYRQRQRLVLITSNPDPSSAMQRLVGAMLHAATRASRQLASDTDLQTATALLESLIVELLHSALQPIVERPGAVDWAWQLYANQLKPFLVPVLGRDSPAVAAFGELWIGLPWGGARFFCSAPTDLSDFGREP